MALYAVSLALLFLQGPGDGWTVQPSPGREVKRLYWEAFETTEVWVHIVPEHPGSPTPLVNLIFQAYYPGPAKRNPYSGNPEEPKGLPSSLVLRAHPLPRTVIRELTLRLDIDGKIVDLTAPGSAYRNLPCLVAAGDCTPNAIEAELKPSVFLPMLKAHSVKGQALGFPIKLTEADQAALAKFAERIGILEPKSKQ